MAPNVPNVRSTVPVFFTVNVCVALVLPLTTEPKSSAVAETLMFGVLCVFLFELLLSLFLVQAAATKSNSSVRIIRLRQVPEVKMLVIMWATSGITRRMGQPGDTIGT